MLAGVLESALFGRRISRASSSSDEEDSIGTIFDLEIVEDRRPGVCGEDPVKPWKRVVCLRGGPWVLDFDFLEDIVRNLCRLKVVQVKVVLRLSESTLSRSLQI